MAQTLGRILTSPPRRVFLLSSPPRVPSSPTIETAPSCDVRRSVAGTKRGSYLRACRWRASISGRNDRPSGSACPPRSLRSMRWSALCTAVDVRIVAPDDQTLNSNSPSPGRHDPPGRTRGRAAARIHLACGESSILRLIESTSTIVLRTPGASAEAVSRLNELASDDPEGTTRCPPR